MKKGLFVACLASVVVVGASFSLAHHHEKSSGHMAYAPTEIEWVDEPGALPPGAKLAVLAGDPTKEGPFTLRLKVPDGYSIPHHWHPKAEAVTILNGTLHMGIGETADKDKAKALSEGAFMFIDAEVKHYGWTTGETVMQVSANGPFIFNYVNPDEDPRNKK